MEVCFHPSFMFSVLSTRRKAAVLVQSSGCVEIIPSRIILGFTHIHMYIYIYIQIYIDTCSQF